MIVAAHPVELGASGDVMDVVEVQVMFDPERRPVAVNKLAALTIARQEWAEMQARVNQMVKETTLASIRRAS